MLRRARSCNNAKTTVQGMTGMEAFSGVFTASANLMDTRDPAARRSYGEHLALSNLRSGVINRTRSTTINHDFDEFVHAELACMRSAHDTYWHDGPVVPTCLFYPVDAAGLDVAVRSRTLPAHDWRLGHDPSLVRYGVELVEAFLAARQAISTTPLREQFCRATRTNFNPRGTHFDGFIARLFEDGGACAAASHPGYALGVRVAGLPVRLGQALYAPAHQLSIVASIYQACEDYFVYAVERFGEHYCMDLLTPCWDTFRHVIGPLLFRFRPPALAAEREWIALALALPQPGKDPVIFTIADNRLVPGVALSFGAQTLAAIVVGIGDAFDATREVLLAYLSRQGMHGVGIIRTAESSGAAGKLRE